MVSHGIRVLMLLENNPYSRDRRVRLEATTLVAAGYQVSVICPRTVGGREWHQIIGAVDVYAYPPPPSGAGTLGYIWEYGYSLVVTFLLSFIIFISRGFDVVHAHNPPDVFFVIGGFYKLLGKRFVYDHHDLAPEIYVVKFSRRKGLLYDLLVYAERWSCKMADCVIVTNDSHRQIVIDRGGARLETVFIVRNGPDLDRFRPTDPDEDLRAKGGVVIGYVGILGLQDGVDHLLRALLHLRRDLGRKDFFCVIVGSGDALANLKQMAADLDVADHVWFTGWVSSDKTLVRYLSAVDIGVVPDPSNPYSDRSTMAKVMEYMSLEKPIVAYDLPENRFSAGDAALYASPNDELDFACKILQLMEDEELRSKMGRLGRARIETQLAWQYSAENLLRAYDSLELSDRAQTKM